MNESKPSDSDVTNRISKSHNHDHFWIEDGVLYESYNTIRGIRWRSKLEVPGMPDEERCSEACLNYIVKEYMPT